MSKHSIAVPALRTTLAAAAALLATHFPAFAQGRPIHASVSFPSTIEVTATQPYMHSIAVADFNRDGRPDVVVSSDYLVAWYPNNADGTFGPRQTITTSLLFPFSVFASDIDQDGRPDVVVASFLDNQVIWFRNDGGGGSLFGGPRVISTSANYAKSVSAADLDGDGLTDILSTSGGSAPGDSKIAWYRNLGGGNFGSTSTNQNVILGGGSAALSIRAADLDGDGVRDLLVTSTNTLAWFKGSLATGTLQFTRYIISNTQTGLPTASIADVDGDGWPDAVCVAPTSNSVTWFRNRTHDAGTSDPFFGPAQLISNLATGVRSVTAIDLDGDGTPEVAAAALTANKVTWYRNLSGGNFGWNPNAPAENEKLVTANAPGATAVDTADFNLDGVPDLVAASQLSGKVTVYLNTGGQCAMASTNTAPATQLAGSRDDLLKIAVSNRGLTGDNNAKISTLTLLLEKGPGVPMTTLEANGLIDRLQLFVDSDNSGSLEFASDAQVGEANNLQLTGGRLTFTPQPANASDIAIAPGITRNFFVVARLATNAVAQNPNVFRMTHVSLGSGRSVIADALSGTSLTVEPAVNPDEPSAFVSATQPHTYADWSIVHFDAAGAPGTAPTDSRFPSGVSNLFKYAFAGDPLKNNGTVSLPEIKTSGGAKLFRHRKLSWATDLTYHYWISRDMLAWEPAVNGVHFQQSDTFVADGVTQSDLTILGPWTKSFMQVRLELAN